MVGEWNKFLKPSARSGLVFQRSQNSPGQVVELLKKHPDDLTFARLPHNVLAAIMTAASSQPIENVHRVAPASSIPAIQGLAQLGWAIVPFLQSLRS